MTGPVPWKGAWVQGSYHLDKELWSWAEAGRCGMNHTNSGHAGFKIYFIFAAVPRQNGSIKSMNQVNDGIGPYQADECYKRILIFAFFWFAFHKQKFFLCSNTAFLPLVILFCKHADRPVSQTAPGPVSKMPLLVNWTRCTSHQLWAKECHAGNVLFQSGVKRNQLMWPLIFAMEWAGGPSLCLQKNVHKPDHHSFPHSHACSVNLRFQTNVWVQGEQKSQCFSLHL